MKHNRSDAVVTLTESRQNSLRTLTITLIGTCGAFAISQRLQAQDLAVDTTVQSTETVRVFLDCQTFSCDFDHFRREIDFVNWVRDRQDADVHVLGTGQNTGGGGQDHTLAFIGLRGFAGRVDTLRYISSDTDTEAEIRDGLVRTVKLGLVRYVANTPAAQYLDITYRAPGQAPPQRIHDPWNLWVFTFSASGDFYAESEQRFYSGDGLVHANRTAEDWKLDFFVSGRLSRDETDVPELDTTFVNTQKRFRFEGLAVRSVSDHWSAGVRAVVAASNFINTDLGVQGGPAIEYNLYPYSESTRRQMTFLYSLGIVGFVYEEETVFGKTSEVRPIQMLDISLEVVAPWGSLNTSLVASQFLHDLNKHKIDLAGGVSVRLFRGLNFNLFAGASRIKNQLYISGAGLTPEERLQRTGQFETDFRFFGGVGFSYRFGSTFANVVNTRLGRATGSIF